VSELETRPLEWLWRSWLLFGKLTILDGDPGLGKSLLALDLCARLSTGRPMPDGTPGPAAAGSLVLSGEDDPSDTIRPRLLALGADTARVYIPERDDDPWELLRLPSQTAALDRLLARTGARLVVIDPLVSFLDPGLYVGSEQGMRHALAPLARLAALHRCAVLLLHHLNKRGSSHALYRGLGAIGLVGACRSGWLVALDPEAPARRVLAPTKANYAPAPPSLAFETMAAGEAVTLSWLGATSWSADGLLAGGKRGAPPPTARERARDFLAAVLEDGPRTSRDLWALAQEQGLSERTLYRAKEALGVRCQQVFVGGQRTT
jgi:hypothetical protein